MPPASVTYYSDRDNLQQHDQDYRFATDLGSFQAPCLARVFPAANRGWSQGGWCWLVIPWNEAAARLGVVMLLCPIAAETHLSPQSLYARMDRMKKTIQPLFTDMTWGAGGSTSDISMDLGLYAQRTGHVSNLHLTCTNLQDTADPKEAIFNALKTAHEGGIRNIVALRGDPPAGQEEWKASEGGFTCALDLVLFIREKFGDDFGISVAGYPEGHPNAISVVEDPSTLTEDETRRASSFDGVTYCCLEKDYESELEYLKRKVDAGAGTRYFTCLWSIV